ncbi:MAG: HD domain-containing protein [Clostridiaceae bacterium]|nr:HD domain-containing protein [Clostridiaceae bacterium]
MESLLSKINELTEEYGGQWGINHTKRLLKLISIIGEELQYNHEAVTIAAYLHDWGGYAKWAMSEINHAIRSRQVAEEFLTEIGCENYLMELVLECIEYHHSATGNNSIEAILLSDADALDFLGTVGVLRDFSKNPKNLRKAYETVVNRRDNLQKRLLLEKSQELAKTRINSMDQVLCSFEEETFGYF